MDLKEVLTGSINIILGKIKPVNEAELLDFKEEIESALKAGLITKAEAAELIQSRNNLKAEAKIIEKKQLEETKEKIKDIEEKAKQKVVFEKEESEEEKRRKNRMLEQNRIQTENIQAEKIEQKDKKVKQENLRDKLNKAIELDEKEQQEKDLEIEFKK